MNSFRCLAIDTSTEQPSVAACQGEKIATRQFGGARETEQIFTHVRHVLTETDQELGDLDCIAIGCGPGSFTGLRVGVAAAQSLAFGRDGSLWVMTYRSQADIVAYDGLGGRLMLVEPGAGTVVASVEVPGHCVHEAADGNVYVASLSGSVLQVRPRLRVGEDAQRGSSAADSTAFRWSELT